MIELLASLILQRDMKTVLFDLTLIKVAHPYGWYLQYLAINYLLVWLIFMIAKKRRMQVILMISIMVGSFAVFYGLNDNLRAEQSLSFFGGVLLAMNMRKADAIMQERNCKLIVGMSALAISAFFLILKQTSLIRVDYAMLVIPINLLMKTFAAVGIILCSYRFVGKIKWLELIGEKSYALYLVHGYTAFIVTRLLLGNWFLSAATFFLITIPMAFVWDMCMKYVRNYVCRIVG